ncbi:MAG: ABC transporter ATP-binding protein [Candidatus Berkelbacteria bacterium]|nr:ABC transporter ATP-binding protein [Candidatus Berkelbacteria bacterium]
MKNIWRLFGLIPTYKTRLLKVVLINTALGLVALLVPIIYKYVLDSIVGAVGSGFTAEVEAKIFTALAMLLGIYLVNVAFEYVSERLSDFLFIDVMWEIRKKMFRHLSTLSIDYYEQNRSGEILEKIGNGTMSFARWVYMIADGTLSTFISILLILVFLWIKLPVIGLVMTIALPLTIYISVLRVLKTKPLRREWMKRAEKGMGEIGETLSQVSTVRSFAQENYKLERYSKEVDDYRVYRLRQARYEWGINAGRGVLHMVTIVLSIGIVAIGTLKGTYTVGDILLVSLYFQQLRGNLGPLSRAIAETGDIETAAERMVEILDVQPTVVDLPQAKTLSELKSIQFKDVSFQYPGKETKILKNISFMLNSGQTLALVGPSGVGKTTITKLLLRFYAPTSGKILINGEPIENFTQDSVRGLIGTVMQDVALFNETIEENLRFARPKATEEEIRSAAKTAHADIFIDKLQLNYKTLVGERGIKLSGGEKQRVAIARAILRDPQLIILDEATSSLDSRSEQFVQDGLHKLMSNKTAVVIAHRLSTVTRADKIIVLEKGKVLEQGNHDQLLKKKGLYAKLFSIQSPSSDKTIDELLS